MSSSLGRPPASDPLVNPVPIRFRESERRLVEDAAAADGSKLSAWIREAALLRARAQRPESGGTVSES